MVKSCTFAFLTGFLCLCSAHTASAQSSIKKDHYPTYHFKIEEGISSARDAARLDSVMVQLKDMVVSSSTNAETKYATIKVVDYRITFESLKDFMARHGYTPSRQFSLYTEEE
jgi:hypothetical protein